MAGIVFDGLILGLARLDPNPRQMFESTKDIERTGLDGVEIKKFGKRPIGFESFIIEIKDTANEMAATVQAILGKEKTVGNLDYESTTFTNVELFQVIPLSRTTSRQGPVQRFRLIFRQVR